MRRLLLPTAALLAVVLAPGTQSPGAAATPPVPVPSVPSVTAPSVTVPGLPAPAPSIEGADVSWPQCQGGPGYGLPMPGRGKGFVVVGLTQGLPFTPNPCLDAQVAHVRTIGARLGTYTFAAWPTRAELARATGPYDTRTQLGRYGNAGYAQGAWSASLLRGRGLQVPLVWLDVEHRKKQPWSKDTRANRAVVLGAVRALEEAGLRVGFYSYANGWREITGGLRSLHPVWATAGRRGRSAARAMCATPSFSGGPVLVAQWYDAVRDSDIACPALAGGAAPDELAAYAHLVLRHGSSGPAVAALRKRLGMPVAPGFSRETSLAVRAFQKRAGLRVDGVVGPLTWRALGAHALRRSSGPGRWDEVFAPA